MGVVKTAILSTPYSPYPIQVIGYQNGLSVPRFANLQGPLPPYVRKDWPHVEWYATHVYAKPVTPVQRSFLFRTPTSNKKKVPLSRLSLPRFLRLSVLVRYRDLKGDTSILRGRA